MKLKARAWDVNDILETEKSRVNFRLSTDTTLPYRTRNRDRSEVAHALTNRAVGTLIIIGIFTMFQCIFT